MGGMLIQPCWTKTEADRLHFKKNRTVSDLLCDDTIWLMYRSSLSCSLNRKKILLFLVKLGYILIVPLHLF